MGVPLVADLLIGFFARLAGSGVLWASPLGSSAAVWVRGAVSFASSIAFVSMRAFAEEFGWRGQLLSRVQVLVTECAAALVVGFLHGVLPVPLMVFATTYNSVGNWWSWCRPSSSGSSCW